MVPTALAALTVAFSPSGGLLRAPRATAARAWVACTDASLPALLDFLRRYEPAAEVLVDERYYTELKLPSASLDTFAELFRALDAEKGALGVREYGLSCTTLEDVFMRINQNNLDRLDRLSSVCRRSHSTICIVTLLSEYYLYAYSSTVCILELASMHISRSSIVCIVIL